MKTATKKEKTIDERIAESGAKRQPYLDLLKSLDDRLTAQNFRDKQLNRAKEILSYIFMVTSGAFVAPDDQDWAQEHLIEVFEMFQIRHKNFELPQFAEDLQECIYRETFAYSDNSSDWKKDILAKRGLENGVELSETTHKSVLDLSEQPEVETETDDEEKYTGDAEIGNLALMLSGVLTNPNLPVNVYNALSSAIDDVFNELPSEENEEISSYQTSPEYLAKLIQLSK